MPSQVNLSGMAFGKLTVLKLSNVRSCGGLVWICLCECGQEKSIASKSLIAGKSKSCGCLQQEAARRTGIDNKKHGHCLIGISGTYRSWQMMIQRCTNPKRSNFKYYGGRGVQVCEMWMEFDSFLKDMGERPSKEYCISRNKDLGNYEPGNASWKLKTANIDEMNARRLSL